MEQNLKEIENGRHRLYMTYEVQKEQVFKQMH